MVNKKIIHKTYFRIVDQNRSNQFVKEINRNRNRIAINHKFRMLYEEHRQYEIFNKTFDVSFLFNLMISRFRCVSDLFQFPRV